MEWMTIKTFSRSITVALCTFVTQQIFKECLIKGFAG
jgi:hypothetical protein